MLKELSRKIDELSKNFHKEKNIKRNQSELKNTIITMKNSLERINSILDDAEE